MRRNLLIITLIVAFILSTTNCRNVEKQSVYTRDGITYGVTRGLFQHRWWHYYERAVSFEDGKFWEEAEADLRQALKQRDEDQYMARTYGMHFIDFFPHRELGVSLFHLNRLQEAMEELEISLAAEPSAKAQFYIDKARKAWIDANNSDIQSPEIHASSLEKHTATKELTFFIEGSAEDDTFVRYIRVNGKPVRVDVSAKTIPFKVEVPLRQGDNPVTIEATDLTGKTSRMAWNIFCDRTGPVLNLDDLTAEPDGDGQYRVEGYAYDASAIKSIKINGQAISTQDSAEADISYLASLSPESGSIFITAEDKLGNETRAELFPKGAAVETASVVVDPVLLASLESDFTLISQAGTVLAAAASSEEAPGIPKISIKIWKNNQTVYRDRIDLYGKAVDDGEVRKLRIDKKDILRKAGKNIFFHETQKLEEGDNLFIIEAVDADGNRIEKQLTIRRKIQKIYALDSRMKAVKFPLQVNGQPEADLEGAIMEDLEATDRFDLENSDNGKSDLDDAEITKIARENDIEFAITGKINVKPDSLEILMRVIEADMVTDVGRVDVYGENLDADQVIDMCKILSLKLRDAFPLVLGKVEDITGRRVTINLGEQDGIVNGMHLMFFEEGESGQGESSPGGADTEELGTARVRTVMNDMSRVEILDDDVLDNLKVGSQLVMK